MDMNEEYEKIVTEIIANSGMARSCILQAIRAVREGKIAECDSLCEEAEKYLENAHLTQTELLREEISGKGMAVTLLMVHAQDHLMTAITTKELGMELIKEIKERRNREASQHKGLSA